MTKSLELEPTFDHGDEADPISKVDFQALYQEARDIGAPVPNDLEVPDDPLEREATAVELQKIIHEHLDALATAVETPDGVMDLTGCEPEAVLTTLDALTGSANVVLHGGKTTDFAAVANAPGITTTTTDASTAVFQATANPSAASSRLAGSPLEATSPVYGSSEVGRFVDVQSGSLIDAVYRAHGDDPTLYSDGYIFILDRHQFNRTSTNAQDKSADWSTTRQVKPLAIIKVSSAIGPNIVTRAQLGNRNDTSG